MLITTKRNATKPNECVHLSMLNAETNITTKTILEEEVLLTIEEACTYLAMSRRTFEKNVMPYINRYGSDAKWFYKKQELKSYFLSTKQKAKVLQESENQN